MNRKRQIKQQITILATISSFLLFSCSTKINDVKLVCSYQMYACGDCAPQYNVISVIDGDHPILKELPGKDISVKFEEEIGQTEILEEIGLCLICYNYTIEGSLMAKPKNEDYEIIPRSFSASIKNDSCCLNVDSVLSSPNE